MGTDTKEAKCVIWDLDNTIWEGTLLESDNVRLKPDIRRIITELDNRGILNSIASKNNYDDAIVQLKKFNLAEYFLYPEINWNAKSLSITNIHKNLNIGLDTLIFIDDEQFEIDEVKNVHSDIYCLKASSYKSLLGLPRLNPKFITADSKRRRQMYLADVKRQKVEENFQGAPEEFLSSLNMKFLITDADEEDLKRAEELTVRTHQLNSTGITFSYDELDMFRKSEKYRLLVCELNDNYGSYGKIGLALIEKSPRYWHLKLLLMSCRVMSRGVGTILLTYIMNEAKKQGKQLLADFKKTDRNRQMYITYKFSNFKEVKTEDNGYVLFKNDLSIIPPYPAYIKLNF